MFLLKIPEIIINLIKDRSYLLEEIIEKNEQNYLLIEVFEVCFNFLINYCFDNIQSSKCLFCNFNFFIRCLEFYEVG